MTDVANAKSLYEKTFGKRSLLSVLVGGFFADKNNAASVIAIVLVLTLCYIVAWKEKYEYCHGTVEHRLRRYRLLLRIKAKAGRRW